MVREFLRNPKYHEAWLRMLVDWYIKLLHNYDSDLTQARPDSVNVM